MKRDASITRIAVALTRLVSLSLALAPCVRGFSIRQLTTTTTRSEAVADIRMVLPGTAAAAGGLLRQFTSASDGRAPTALNWSGCATAGLPGRRSQQRLLRSSATPAVSLSSNEDLLPGISAIRSANSDLHRMLEVVREQPYFRLYSVDILASCEYLPQELFECYTESCEIYPAEEGEVGWLVPCLRCRGGAFVLSSCFLDSHTYFRPLRRPSATPP